MIIVSQDGTERANIEQLPVIHLTNITCSDGRVVWSIEGLIVQSRVFLGDYKTKERALEVLKEIDNAYMSEGFSGRCSRKGRNMMSYKRVVYYMPKEEQDEQKQLCVQNAD